MRLWICLPGGWDTYRKHTGGKVYQNLIEWLKVKMLRMIINTAHTSSCLRWYPESVCGCFYVWTSVGSGNICTQPILPITPKSSLIHTFIVCKRGKQNQYTVMQGKLGICVIYFSSVERLWCFDLSLTPRHLPPHPLSLSIAREVGIPPRGGHEYWPSVWKYPSKQKQQNQNLKNRIMIFYYFRDVVSLAALTTF